MIQRLLMLTGVAALGLLVAGCFPFSSDQPAAPQQQGPVVVPVINQSSDNSGWFVLVTIIIVGLGAAVWAAIRHAMKETDRRRDAEALANRILDALPEDMERDISYALGYRPGVHRNASIPTPARRAIGGGR